MCQLFGLSTATPIRLQFSWERFALRGSEAVGNPDGWGVAYAESTDVRILREPSPAADSPLVSFLASHGPASRTVISHVRRATDGARGLVNTQPFVRALGGRTHVFAHNGHVPSLQSPPGPWLRSIGSTDSEVMFCILLGRLESLWGGAEIPALESRSRIVASFANEMRSLGAANFLYFDGETLFAHSHRRTIPGDGISPEPGLYLLQRSGTSGPEGHHPCDGLDSADPHEAVALIATMPLDEQPWRALQDGELLRLEDGRLV